MLKIKNVTIEGPDLSGKTTLYNMLHQKSSFRWNIQDRSQLSMICYARQFSRGEEVESLWRMRLDEYLSTLNNRLIVLLPNLSVINKRYLTRGDEIQNLDSLYSLYEIFSDEVKRIESLPNVLVLRGDGSEDLTNICYGWCAATENYELDKVASEVSASVEGSDTNEITPLSFSIAFENPESLLEDVGVLCYPPEEVYYANILHKVLKNIQDETAGKNDYNTPQNPFSTRRFIFTQDSCISLIHTMVRDKTMEIHVVCRSSDVINTFPYDLRFLSYLYGRVFQKINPKGITRHNMRVTLNSAHIVE